MSLYINSFILCLFASLIWSGCTLPVNVSTCVYHGHQPTGQIIGVDISPITSCGLSCVFHKSSTYTVTVKFHAGAGSTYTKTDVTAHIGLSQPMSLYKTPNDCGSQVQCPILPGSDVTYTAQIKAPAMASNQIMVAKWVIKGDGNRAMVCFEFPFRIAN